MNIAITGGGTGGHLAIANAFKEELNKRGFKPIYIGSQSGQDRAWFDNDTGFKKCYFLNSKGVVNKKGFTKLLVLFQILKEIFTCKSIFTMHEIDAIFCVGGYSAAPASFASILFRKPLYIHEQNAITGNLNKLLKPFAKEFFSSYDKNSKVLDYPVSEKFFLKKRLRKELKTIIFLGGSQGAKVINDLAMQSAKELSNKGIKIIHQTGKNDFERVSNFYKENSIDALYFDFSKELLDHIQNADFAISRAGASTLWELCANNLPALFIPYPYAANNHQFYNAKVLLDKHLAYLCTEKDLNIEVLFDTLSNANIHELSFNLQSSIKQNGIKQIADIILKKS